ncbi:MAG: hypothetical protein ACSHX6_05125 [Akkermansiaceae bacterium]
MNKDDTLFEDTTGHAVGLFEGIEEEGLAMAYDILNTSESEWDMGFGWAVAQLLAVETIAACAGQPSQSPECHFIVEWAAENPASISLESRERMLYIIDRVIEKHSPDTECGQLMRKRIENIVASDHSPTPVMKRDPRTGELLNESSSKQAPNESQKPVYDPNQPGAKPWWKFW